MSANVNTNQLNDVVENELKFYSSNSIANIPVKDSLPMETTIFRGGKSLDIP